MTAPSESCNCLLQPVQLVSCPLSSLALADMLLASASTSPLDVIGASLQALSSDYPIPSFGVLLLHKSVVLKDFVPYVSCV